MNHAVYNPSTNKVRSWVTEPRGSLPDGWEFRAQADVPSNATQEEVAVLAPVPASVSLRQFRMALKREGLFAAVDSLRTNPALTVQQQDDLTEFLEFSNVIDREHELIVQLAPLIGVTTERIDSVFRVADTL